MSPAAAPSSPVAKARNRSSRSKNASSSAWVRLYGLPPTIASLEWNNRFSTGSPARARSRASAIMSSSDEYEGRSQRMRTRPSARSTRLVVYGRGARAYACCSNLRQPPVQCRRHRHFEHVAAAGPSSRCRRPGNTASAAPRRTPAPPCALRRTAARRSTRPGSRAVRGRRRESAEKPNRPERYDTGRFPTAPFDRVGQRRQLRVRTASRGSVEAYGWRRTSSGVHGGVSHA